MLRHPGFAVHTALLRFALVPIVYCGTLDGMNQIDESRRISSLPVQSRAVVVRGRLLRYDCSAVAVAPATEISRLSPTWRQLVGTVSG
jgi:hypothetical protein